jgi:DNA-binding NtrC family response regulator
VANEPDEVLLLDTDLFFVVKVTDTLKHAGYTTHSVRNERAFAQALSARRPIAALVNTAARGVDYVEALAAARAVAVPAVAYGPHGDLAAQQSARDAGATLVVSNSRLAADLPGIIARALRQGPASESCAESPEDESVAAPEGSPDGACDASSPESLDRPGART